MRSLLLALAIFLTGCDSPSPRFVGAPQADVTVGGMRFSVRRNGDLVEAFRLGFVFRPSEAEVLANGQRAIEIATGCAVRGLSGDQALIKARLDCTATSLPQPVNQRAGRV